MTAWATAADCAGITSITPDDATLALAQSTVEDAVNRTPDADESFTTRDLNWLKKAVAYQAAWIPSQPGLLARVGTTGISQDGLNATYGSRADLLLSPLAQRALKNLTWMGSRSIHVRNRDPYLPYDVNPVTAEGFLSSGSDTESDGWEPL